MTDPDEYLTLETPHDWVRQGEERAEREWAQAHPARPICDQTPSARSSRGNEWPWFVALALLFLLLGEWIPWKAMASPAGPRSATIAHPVQGPATALVTTTAKATVKWCGDRMVAGTLTNTGGRTQAFVIAVRLDRGNQMLAIAAPDLLRDSPGATVTWSSPVPLGPTGAVTCSLSVYSVLP